MQNQNFNSLNNLVPNIWNSLRIFWAPKSLSSFSISVAISFHNSSHRHRPVSHHRGFCLWWLSLRLQNAEVSRGCTITSGLLASYQKLYLYHMVPSINCSPRPLQSYSFYASKTITWEMLTYYQVWLPACNAVLGPLSLSSVSWPWRKALQVSCQRCWPFLNCNWFFKP